MSLKINFFVAAFFSLTLNTVLAQNETPNLPIDSSTKKITYSDVVYLNSLTTKQEFYSRAREWFAKNYKSSTNVIQMEDKESGKIVGKALFQVYYKALGTENQSGYINYTISLYFKDGRYKYLITDFYHTGQDLNGNRVPDFGSCDQMINTQMKYPLVSHKKIQKTFNSYLIQLDNNIKILIFSLKESMNVKSTNNKNDNW